MAVERQTTVSDAPPALEAEDPAAPESRPGRVRDEVGEATLELLEANSGYTGLLWERLRALGSLEGRVLEVGCGIGSLTRRILAEPAVAAVHALDIDSAYVERLRREVGDPRLEVSCSSAEGFRAPPASFDRAISSNVFEHIEDDAAAMQRVADALRPGGEFWILVPAHPRLYCGLDAALSHHRRYTRRSLAALARGAGLEPAAMRHFNPLGAIGWWLTGAVLGRRTLGGAQVSFYDRYGLALSRFLDRWNPFPFGISLVARLTKPAL
jgi:SAM-dependent methyltransferase